MKGIMIQGTASDVGKSFVATGLCRILANKGCRAAPFKSQSITSLTYNLKNGKEIALPQGLQAEAAKVEATEWMNPVLIKSLSNKPGQTVLLGEQLKRDDSFDRLSKQAVEQSIKRLKKEFELLVIEGAGSPVEMNIKDKDTVNMKIAKQIDVPVILVADIEKGGVFASIVGTLELLTPSERKRIQGIVINKFHGDPLLFKEGTDWIEEKTGVPVLGVLPHLEDFDQTNYDQLAYYFEKHMDLEKLLQTMFNWGMPNAMD